MSGNLPRSKGRGNELNAVEKSTINQGHSSGDCSRNKTNEIRLQDINDQLKMAQSRCNYLKDQLDYMKKMYGVNRNSQKLNYVGTDNNGAVIRTISNILNRITNPVNHVSEIHSQLTTPRIKISSEVNTNVPKKTKNIDIVPELKIESLTSIAPNHRSLKKIASKSGRHTIIINKPARVNKKIRSVSTKSKTGLEKKCPAVITNQLVSKFNFKNSNLVEIYHNEAVMHSYSDESDLKKSQKQCERPSREDVPPLNIYSNNRQSGPEQTATTKLTYPAEFTGRFTNKSPEALKTEVKWVYSKNYKLPTVASRMKQVTKAYMGKVKLKTIPFCAAISTTQSHNIGINIQQVMNIIKNRQPVNGISPTLAHNIGLAAKKLNNKSFSAFVSNINSQISQSVSRCPLTKTVLNIQQLRKQAKTIPEWVIKESYEEVDKDAREAPEAQSVLITGPSGDMETKPKTVPDWEANKNVNTRQQTCLAQNIKTITENNLNSQEKELRKRLKGYKTTTGSQLDTKVQPKVAEFQGFQIHTTTQEENFNAKERNPKGFLSNLHTDFEYVNSRFEDLFQKSQAVENEASIKKLGRLEEELNEKEEAITLEITLYKELLALKQEVKQLKEERSQSSLLSREHNQNTEIRYKKYKNPEAAFLLTKLLKQIQHCQMIYKSSLNQE
ncbi:uncharacterized protein [Euwallacea similis]|uniref:uncharacterized protein n=1 Tax=Euwallacea similis TaxID=1736056 RepID=UPI00344C22DB